MAKLSKTDSDNKAESLDITQCYTKKKILPEEKHIQRLVIIAMLSELRVNQAELCKILDIHSVTLSSWKRGVTRIPLDMAEKMANLSKLLKISDFFIVRQPIA